MGRHKKKPKQINSSTKIEQTVAKVLTELSLPFHHNVPLGRYTVDFLVADKVIVECYGDFWHANPAYYDPDYYNKALKCHAIDRWRRDSVRRAALVEMGYRFLILWETDIKKNPKFIRNRLRALRQHLDSSSPES